MPFKTTLFALIALSFAAALPGCGDKETTTDDSEVPTDDSSADDTATPVETPTVVINEFMASNATIIADAEGGYADWIELYNGGDAAVDLSGWFITDDLASPEKHVLGAITIEAGGYVLLWADDDILDGDDHLAFKLSGDGEDLALYTPEGVAADELTYQAQTTDQSAARFPDGGETWAITDAPTPGASNGDGT
ncbi:lamin tail domain-containing protein [Myxococcota bacterium]|nr:lamin tail domain-containing protein [Myxococcota bacterium]